MEPEQYLSIILWAPLSAHMHLRWKLFVEQYVLYPLSDIWFLQGRFSRSNSRNISFFFILFSPSRYVKVKSKWVSGPLLSFFSVDKRKKPLVDSPYCRVGIVISGTWKSVIQVLIWTKTKKTFEKNECLNRDYRRRNDVESRRAVK